MISAELSDQAIDLNRGAAAYYCDRAHAYRAMGRIDLAAMAYNAARLLMPDFAEATGNLGLALWQLGRCGEALTAFAAALRLAPLDARAHSNLGVALKQAGRLEPAVAAYRMALCLQPGLAGGSYNLANLLQELGHLDRSVAAFGAALRLNPTHTDAHNNLGNARQDAGEVEDAVTDYKRALVCQPHHDAARMNLAFAQLYRPSVGLADIAHHARRWASSHASGFTWPAHPVPIARSPRIGLISADFRCHAVGWLVIPAIEGLARAGVHLTCYSNSPRVDRLTDRFIGAATGWRSVVGLSDSALADLIRTDGIDILIDLSGYSIGNRLPMFARKPAPIQIASWVGYPATTGLAAMDYILADRWQIPKGAETHYTEAVIRLPDSIIVFEPPDDAPPLSDLPALTETRITFGSFNLLRKITPDCIATWSRLLNSIPDARLIMKSVALQHSRARRRYEALFAGHHIAAERLQFLGGTSSSEHMAWMACCDIALDSFPYSGGRTTLEALWMGLPVVTRPGESFASRHSLSYLSSIGLSDMVASDREHYIELAVTLASDLPRLADLRRGMRQRILASPLCDSEKFSSDLATALTMIWQRHCDGLAPAGFDLCG